MATAYDLLGVRPGVTRTELEAAYANQRAVYDPAYAATLGEEFAATAARRRAELAAAYRDLRAVVGGTSRLAPAEVRQRDRETMVALLVLVAVALLAPLLHTIAVPQRTVTAQGSDAAALTSRPAPDFTLPTLAGKKISLSEYKGRVVLINLWATWCPSCVREMPALVRISQKFRDQGLVVLGVDTVYQDDRAKVAQFVHDQGVTYPIVLDVDDVFGEKYGARLLPTSYLVDQSGKIVYVRVGEADEAQFEEQVQALLKRTQGTS